jgi:acetyl esterase/lipase
MNRLTTFTVIVALMLLAALSSYAGEDADREISIEHDMPYLGPDREEKLDMYRPVTDDPNERFPAIVMIHGGGFVGGDKGKSREINIGTNLAKAGYVCISVNYRLGDNSWPTNIKDCKTAVQFLRRYADDYQIDADHIGAIGGSAGGHLASMLGVVGPDVGLEPDGPYAGFSSRVQAAADLYGISNLLTRQEPDDDGNPTGTLKDGAAERVLGAGRDEDPDLWKFASPVNHVTKDDPPFLIMHGKADTTVDYLQSIEFAEVLEKTGVEHTLHLLEGVGHTFDLQTWRNKPMEIDLRPIVVGFLDNHLKHDPNIVTLWPNGTPGAPANPARETIVNRSETTLDRGVENVHKPAFTAHLPGESKNTGTAVIICPGGGYGKQAYDKEGHDVARWLNSFGVAAFVLKYRLPRPEGHVYGYKAPLADVQRAVRIVRNRAKEWNVDPGRVGVMGFSAGGHLASSAGTHFDPGIRDDVDDLRHISCRPDFLVLGYPVISMDEAIYHGGSTRNLLGDAPDPKLLKLFSNELQVTEKTPPTFLVSTSDDRVNAENSMRFYLALKRAGVPAEMHIYEKGGHGYGIRKTDINVSNWPERCRQWMDARGLLQKAE